MAARGVIVLQEDVASDVMEGVRYLATFSGIGESRTGEMQRIEGAAIDDALAWARSHADEVWVHVADAETPLAAGDAHAADAPRWPPAEPPRPRRPAGDEWRDRPDDAPPIRWAVELDVWPYADDDASEQELREEIDRLAEQLRASAVAPAPDGEDPRGKAILPAGPPPSDFAGYAFAPLRLTLEREAPNAASVLHAAAAEAARPGRWDVVVSTRPS